MKRTLFGITTLLIVLVGCSLQPGFLSFNPVPTYEVGVLHEGTPVVGLNADIAQLVSNGALKGGNPQRGAQLYQVLGCIACHSINTIAPPTEGTFTRIVETRLKDPANAGKSPEGYIAESILYPDKYVVPKYAVGIMPRDWGSRLTIEDLKDLIAFLNTQR